MQAERSAFPVWKNIAALVVAIAVPLAIGGIGSVATSSAIPGWYAQLELPDWAPPDWVFGPVWTALYIAMGMAAWLVWRQGWHWPRVRVALALFTAQLLLNLGWTLIFFGLESIVSGWVEIIVLWAFILATIVAFARVHVIAALLLVPYLAWVTFATAPNAAIWRLN
ncbi:MAG: TspO/MBR family protein [Dehalococcoidia bacterium]